MTPELASRATISRVPIPGSTVTSVSGSRRSRRVVSSTWNHTASTTSANRRTIEKPRTPATRFLGIVARLLRSVERRQKLLEDDDGCDLVQPATPLASFDPHLAHSLLCLETRQ